MAVNYEVWLSDQFGTRIALLDTFETLSWTRVVNDVGQMEISFTRSNFDRDLFWGLDRRLEIWRAPVTGILGLIRIYFLRFLGQRLEGSTPLIVLKGPDAIDLVDRRITAADAGSAGATKSGTADDVMKEYVDENLGGSAAAGRDLTGDGFSVQADLTLAQAIDKAASRRNLLTVCQELAQSSTQLGTDLFFDVMHPTPATFEFRTYMGRRGSDRTIATGQNPVLLAPEMGNLSNVSYDQDWRGEVTFVYGAGQGLEDDRLVVERNDATRLAASVFNRREALFDGRIYSVQASLEDASDARLRELRPKRRFRAEITGTESFRYGRDWNFGDQLTAEFAGETLDVDVLAVQGIIDSNNRETISGRLESVSD